MIYLNKNDSRALYEQLYDKLRNEIILKGIKKDAALWPIRTLAEELQVSNNTVSRAYQQLLAEGYIRSVAGSGYYVENVDHVVDCKLRTKGTILPKQLLKKSKTGLLYDFKYESIDASQFPWTKWRQYMQNAMIEESYASTVSYEVNKGNLRLRESLCHYLGNSRGVRCTPEQIVICAGTQYALDIITSLLPLKRYQVGMEEPGFNAMSAIFLNKGYDITPIPVTNKGIDMDAVVNSQCNLLYLTPSHHFPTGITTSLSSRCDILDWVEEHHMYVIENDYDNEFTYGKKRLPSLQSIDRGEHVIYISTLAKVLSPSIRCAYFVLPESLLQVYEEKYKYYYSSLPTCNQTALASFIDDGLLEKHVRKMAMRNRKKYNVFMNTMMQQMGNRVDLFDSPAGSHILMQIPGCQDQEAFIEQMRNSNIGIYGTKEYYYDAANAREDLFLLGYHSMSQEEIVKGCCAFAEALKNNPVGNAV